VRAVTRENHAAQRVRTLAGRLWRVLVRRPLGRLLHAARRRVALRRVAALGDSLKSILVVCQGNICRSPYAAGALRRMLPGQLPREVAVRSAGFLDAARPAPPAAVTAAARRGVDLGAHRSQRIDPSGVRQADLVIVMDERQERAVRLLFGKPSARIVILADLLPAFGEARAIPDPVDRPLETFERVYGQIDECLAALRTALGHDEGA
jgi:protein-tyrosine phosphatase